MVETICGIYEILNIINNKKYIGQSTDIYTRWANHISLLKNNRHPNEHLQNAWNKYGEMYFSFNIVEVCEENALDNRECFYIEMYETMNPNNGYNLQCGGYSIKVSDESRHKMSVSQKNRWTPEMKEHWSKKYSGENNPFFGRQHSKETKNIIAESNKNRIWSEESKQRLSNSLHGRTGSNKGKKTPDDVKKKISQSLKGRPSPTKGLKHSDETKHKISQNSKSKKCVCQFDTNGILVAEFDSLSAASQSTGIGDRRISECCSGKRNKIQEYVWRYKEDKNMEQSVVGWVSAYLCDYPTTIFTESRRKALVERIRKRRYNFTYEQHQTLPYAAPFYKDKVLCVLTKEQWDSVMDEAYGDMPRGTRSMPMDVITTRPKDDVLYEKNKFMMEEGDDSV